MSVAGVVSCPECGGPVDAGARHCGYCHAPIATVRCARCYAMNSPDAPHCSGCGLGLGLLPIGEPGDLSCPDCGARLTGFSGGPGTLADCERCGGQFVEHDLLRDLIDRREVYGSAAPRPYPKQNPLLEKVVYRKCPACHVVMNRKNFGGSSGIIVDQCTRHGTWFDRGELPRVLAFVESGGLARARRRELEELERKRRDALAATPSPVTVGSTAPWSTRDLTDLDAAGVVLALLELLFELFE
ncbi:MAG TPA: zf-TFIIB domain-containing protein [Polyangiaceae bacterium]|nr:zf-TFIIB domain-containing protein [Polyangiaceae bacterium]